MFFPFMESALIVFDLLCDEMRRSNGGVYIGVWKNSNSMNSQIYLFIYFNNWITFHIES